MTGADLATLAEYLIRTRALVAGIRRLAQVPPDGIADDTAQELDDLETELGLLTHCIQHRSCEAWRARQPTMSPRSRHDAAARVQQRLPQQSSDVETAVVERHDIAGRPVDATEIAPPTSGRWTTERLRGPGSRFVGREDQR